jgi:DNA-binding CsgD family transcriptional regulator
MKDLPLIGCGLYYFYEKGSGVCRFQVEATPEGQFPVEHAAGLLAMHCMAFGQSPSDYVVVISAENDTLKGLTEKTEKILEAGRSVSGRVKLTRREVEVLSGIVRCFANKEIAASLNVTERTIKFHVSSLLAKFQVHGRMELARKAAGHIAGLMSTYLPVSVRETHSTALVPHSFSNPARSPAVVSTAQTAVGVTSV